jgi:cbb3-type cytochrome oxidase maturation protein
MQGFAAQKLICHRSKKEGMGIIYLLIGISLFMGLVFLIAFFWANESGQFDDTSTPSFRILDPMESENSKHQPS